MNLQEQISRIQSMMGINESSETTDDVVGKEFWFEYHCFESPESCDAELWYRTHNKVLVLSIVELGCGETKLERLLEGCPRVYRVVFEDGFEYDVFEDELMESKEGFERPDAPKKNIQEQIRRILKEEISSEVKYLIYIYFCDYEDRRFKEFVSKFENMEIDFWVKHGKGHHRGFAIQSILNTHSKKRALDIANKIYDEFNQDILIVLSKQKVTNVEPIGMNNDKVFIKPGRYFDKLVDKKEKGIYII